MEIDSSTGIIDVALQLPSPNFDERPDGTEIELVVIHGISLPPGQFGGDEVADFFCNQLDCDSHPYFEQIRDVCVSAHLLIRRDGEMIQFVPFHKRAWHAGESSHQGRQGCNDFSIGIELEGTDDLPYTEQQYQVLTRLLGSLYTEYSGLEERNVVGHCDISPGRKTDPGSVFDWNRLGQAE